MNKNKLANKALIIVDYQNEWTLRNSDYFVGDISKEIENTNKLIDYCRGKDFKIIFTKHIEEDSTDAFVEGTSSVELIDEINKETSDTIITKYRISPFFKTNLEEHLKGINEIVVCGILTNLCVRSLVQDAYDRDFQITVIKNCSVSFDKETQDFTFKDLKATREEIEFLNLDEFVL